MSTHSPEMWSCTITSIRPTEMTVSDGEHQRFLWGAGEDFGFPAGPFSLPALPSAHLCGVHPGWYSLSGCPHRWFGNCTVIFYKTFKSVHFHVRNLPPAITGSATCMVSSVEMSWQTCGSFAERQAHCGVRARRPLLTLFSSVSACHSRGPEGSGCNILLVN